MRASPSTAARDVDGSGDPSQSRVADTIDFVSRRIIAAGVQPIVPLQESGWSGRHPPWSHDQGIPCQLRFAPLSPVQLCAPPTPTRRGEAQWTPCRVCHAPDVCVLLLLACWRLSESTASVTSSTAFCLSASCCSYPPWSRLAMTPRASRSVQMRDARTLSMAVRALSTTAMPCTPHGQSQRQCRRCESGRYVMEYDAAAP